MRRKDIKKFQLKLVKSMILYIKVVMLYQKNLSKKHLVMNKAKEDI